MAMPEWSSSFSLDDSQVDQEHQRLLELLGWLETELRVERDMDAAHVKSLVHELNPPRR